MIVKVKPGVIIGQINDPLVHLCYALWYVWRPYGVDPVITSGQDGRHKPGSLHYIGLAWDIRVRDLPAPNKMVAELTEVLNKGGRHDYQVIYGPPDHLDHIHVEYQPMVDRGVKQDGKT